MSCKLFTCSPNALGPEHRFETNHCPTPLAWSERCHLRPKRTWEACIRCSNWVLSCCGFPVAKQTWKTLSSNYLDIYLLSRHIQLYLDNYSADLRTSNIFQPVPTWLQNSIEVFGGPLSVLKRLVLLCRDLSAQQICRNLCHLPVGGWARGWAWKKNEAALRAAKPSFFNRVHVCWRL